LNVQFSEQTFVLKDPAIAKPQTVEITPQLLPQANPK
jgi:hypothetical protein